MALVGEQRTLLMTLAMHAQDAQSARPILGDRWAASTLAAIGSDEPPALTRRLGGNRYLVCARARAIDREAADFLARWPDAVVLHLGCGLDSRSTRLVRPVGVEWYDVDQAPVIELRRRVLPELPGVTTIATSVTETGWTREIPTGRPRLVLAEGLLMYLDQEGVRVALVAVRDDDAPVQELVADTVAPFVVRLADRHPDMESARASFRSTTGDLDAAAGDDWSRLDRRSLVTETARASGGGLGLALRVMSAVPAGARAMELSRLGRGDPR